MATVKIGDLDVTIEEPSIAKVEEIGKKLAQVGKEAPQIQLKLAEFIANYEAKNVVEMDRHTAKVRVPNIVRDLSEADWKALGQKVRLPRSPSPTEQMLAMAPYVFDQAREQALEVVALLMVPDELMEDQSAVQKAIDDNKRMLRYKAKPSQLIVLLSECTEIVREVMEHNRDELGKLRAFWVAVTQGDEQTAESEHEAALAEAAEALGETGGFQSSTDSPPDTGGDTERSSTGSPSGTLSTSST